MKKLTLLMIAIVISITSFSQASFYKVISVTYSQYIDNEWVEQSTNNTESNNIFMIFNNSSIKVTNKNESSFVTYGDATDQDYPDHTAKIWTAYDKNGNDCYIMIKKWKNNTENISVSAIYPDKSELFEYIVENKK